MTAQKVLEYAESSAQAALKALEYAENYARAEWEDNWKVFESLSAELEETTLRPEGGTTYHIVVSALLEDTRDDDMRGEYMMLAIHFDQAGEPVVESGEEER